VNRSLLFRFVRWRERRAWANYRKWQQRLVKLMQAESDVLWARAAAPLRVRLEAGEFDDTLRQLVGKPSLGAAIDRLKAERGL
jgi:hypothetical protein